MIWTRESMAKGLCEKTEMETSANSAVCVDDTQ